MTASASDVYPAESPMPALGDLLLEAPRTLATMATFALLSPRRPPLNSVPRGQGQPVLVLPGLGADDVSTAPLRILLRQLGYRAYGWRLGRNLGPTREVVDGVPESLRTLSRKHGEPVSLIGWSLGGVIAREASRVTPASVRQVVTLGSPFNLRDARQSRAHGQYVRYAHLHDTRFRRTSFAPFGLPLDVPSTAIYSRADGIVAWQTTIQDPGPERENIEVRSSHFGFGINPAAVLVIADRLGQTAGTWRPFRPPRGFRHWYPEAASAVQSRKVSGTRQDFVTASRMSIRMARFGAARQA